MFENKEYFSYVKQVTKVYKSYTTDVAMATMKFQDGEYFGFKVI